MLDLMGLKYTHSGLETSVIAIDKELTKMVLVPHGIRMPEGQIVESESLFERDPMPRPYVLKPVNEGSSVGVAIVTEEGNYGSPIGRDVPGPWDDFDRLLAEPFIKGRELTVAVLNDEAMMVTELRPKAGFYDYAAKYTDGLTEHVCPADVPGRDRRAMMDMAAKAHRLLGCKGASRADFRWDEEQGEERLYLLEVNTQPGMTPLSLVPEQAKQRGISYAELVETLIGEALGDGGAGQARKRRRNGARGVAVGVTEESRRRPCQARTAGGDSLRAVPRGDRGGRAGRARRSRRAMTAAGEAIGRAGFTVKRVDVVGIRNMDSAPVYQIALDQKSMAMPLVDVEGIRERLLRYGWVKDARVSRRLPDTLVDRHRRAAAGGALAGQAAAGADRRRRSGHRPGAGHSDARPAASDRCRGEPSPARARQTARHRSGSQAAAGVGDLGRRPPLGSEASDRRDHRSARGRGGGEGALFEVRRSRQVDRLLGRGPGPLRPQASRQDDRPASRALPGEPQRRPRRWADRLGRFDRAAADRRARHRLVEGQRADRDHRRR
jgi:D-alanine-D-alanine ligase